jgi:hypothetical protein
MSANVKEPAYRSYFATDSESRNRHGFEYLNMITNACHSIHSAATATFMKYNHDRRKMESH